MKKFSIFSIVMVAVLCINIGLSYSQTRVAVLPFKNLDGNLELNIWCYNLQDSLAKALRYQDLEEKNFRIVPIDTVEAAIAALNVDPDNPQYFTDMLAALKKLNISKVVSGEFNIQGDMIIINAKIYDVKLKLPMPKNQARDVFRKVDNAYDSITEITEALYPGI